ncbi:hypothetical protein M2277_000838 [Paenibacillus sp. LBL]|uniref:hypothetical protein n=1 Tax=Paenibacillus sp. LBL TaxID=2940563 RepID=UPI002473748C|nr:hypothetical protein [Paenibacillus sp. LBL]MDH6670194.1 hypothetical protein [Paenibacillus sp. LBL]
MNNQGKSIYFTKPEIGYLSLILQNIDSFIDEEEREIQESLMNKVTKAWEVTHE